MIDLFGNNTKPAAVTPSGRMKKKVVPNGYAWSPGTGPTGKTCGHCEHRTATFTAKTFYKCRLAEERWARGRRTDILVRSPACKFFEQDKPANPGTEQ